MVKNIPIKDNSVGGNTFLMKKLMARLLQANRKAIAAPKTTHYNKSMDKSNSESTC